jgi:hypothetical protein
MLLLYSGYESLEKVLEILTRVKKRKEQKNCMSKSHLWPF